MKSSHWGLVLLAVGLVVGMLVGGGVERQTIAQAPGGTVTLPMQVRRFEISAWGMGYPTPPGSGKGERGCYIVDTATGELWQAAADGQPKKISEKLR